MLQNPKSGMPIDPSPPNEEDLVKRLLARDGEAFVWAVRTYQGKMLSLARAIVGEPFAEEVVQDAWLAVIRGLPNFEGRARLETWILRILSNTAKTRLKREIRHRHAHITWEENPPFPERERFGARGHWSSPPLPWHEETPEALLTSEELQHCLTKAVAALPPAQRAVLTLRDSEGLEMEEICNILEISATNGRVLLHRARARLRTVVENYEKGKGC
ncbi:RNA polymerase sigma factor, sigma-70 family [Nitrosococcus halophilus Nc 4]|uniref:RNA polymerase sigma factor, sigma-70 family n=2 Tax=Nitrosococcus halophilus TaxID=133539 RepID=D5BYM4_NITHN|nr:RNA polymerase sigma factor, sigma-70 family [Nitrosococcus halophilus Nc 4]